MWSPIFKLIILLSAIFNINVKLDPNGMFLAYLGGLTAT